MYSKDSVYKRNSGTGFITGAMLECDTGYITLIRQFILP